MQPSLSLACFLSFIRPPGIQFEDAMLQILPVDKAKCPFVRDKNDIEFRLFTRHNPTVYQELRLDDDEALFASNFNFDNPTVFYFGAFMESPDESSGLLIRQSYMLRGDSNFVILDLSRLEAGPWYFTAAENTWYIGNFAARFIDYMVTRGLNLNSTHLIGHSLGGQSAGVAGSAIKSGRVSRITGLDPALPLFNNLPLPQRLDPSDAEFVDIIHTDAGIFGYKTPIGHVDFYPNGGISPQPGCELEVVLHEQRLLNKCDPNIQLQGFYQFDLTPNKKPTFIEKLLQFFTYISSLIDNYNNTHINSSNDTEGDENDLKVISNEKIRKSPYKLTAERKYKHKSYNNGKKFKNMKAKPTLIAATFSVNDKTNDLDVKRIENYDKTENANTSPTDITTIDTINENSDIEMPYKREKRITNQRDFTIANLTNPENKNIADVKQEEIYINDHENDTFVTELQSLTQNLTHPGIINVNKEVIIKSTIKDGKIETHTKTNNHESDTFETDSDSKTTQNSTNEETNNVTNETNEKSDKLKDESTKTTNHENDAVKTAHNSKTTTRTANDKVQRQKRFINPFRNNENDNFLFRMLEFLVKNRKNVIPVVTVMREINTLVKSAGGELNHISKERNNYIGGVPTLTPIKYDLELGETGIVSFVKKLFGIAPRGGRLSISGNK